MREWGNRKSESESAQSWERLDGVKEKNEGEPKVKTTSEQTGLRRCPPAQDFCPARKGAKGETLLMSSSNNLWVKEEKSGLQRQWHTHTEGLNNWVRKVETTHRPHSKCSSTITQQRRPKIPEQNHVYVKEPCKINPTKLVTTSTCVKKKT